MPIEITRLNHITYNAPSGEEAKVKKFYGEMLGLQEIPIPKALEGIYEITWYKMMDYIFHIEYIKNYSKPKRDTNGAILPGYHMALEVKNIKAFKQDLIKKGAEIKEAVVIPDRERFYVVDPFDNYIEIIEFHKK